MPSSKAVRQSEKLTESQREVLVELRRYLRKNQISPRYEDLAYATGRKKSTVRETVTRLVRKGYVGRKGSRYCSLFVTDAGWKA